MWLFLPTSSTQYLAVLSKRGIGTYRRRRRYIYGETIEPAFIDISVAIGIFKFTIYFPAGSDHHYVFLSFYLHEVENDKI